MKSLILLLGLTLLLTGCGNETTTEGQSTSKSPELSRRDFLQGRFVTAGAVAGVGLGGFYFGYNSAIGSPVRVGVIGTGDEGNVLIGAFKARIRRGQGYCRHPPLQPVPCFSRRLDEQGQQAIVAAGPFLG